MTPEVMERHCSYIGYICLVTDDISLPVLDAAVEESGKAILEEKENTIQWWNGIGKSRRKSLY